VISNFPTKIEAGQVGFEDAARPSLPHATAGIWFTDPPYDDQVPYADLSDFFFVWLKRLLPTYAWLRDPYDPSNPLTPKAAEAVRDERKLVDGKPKDRAFYEAAMAQAFAGGRRVTREDGLGSVIFAHKTTEGWEALLSGMIKGGWVITASWPIATEMATRLRARDSAALATSVHLVCRPRTEQKTGDWADVLSQLPGRVSEWMSRLEREGIKGADLVFAYIGPALEIFSQFSRVETPDGREVPLDEYLKKVWEVVGRTALAQVLGTAEAQAQDGGVGALEEDARLTALFLWTHRSTAGNGTDTEPADDAEDDPDDEDAEENGGGPKVAKGFRLIYDIVRRFAQPLGIHLDAWEGRITEKDKGVVRLLPVSERARQLFGPEGVAGLADRIERTPAAAGQLELFPELHEAEEARPRGRRKRFAAVAARSVLTQATTLDRVHTAMLLQASGRTNGLRGLLAAEQQRGPDFFRLAQSPIPLYPEGHEERRLLEAVRMAGPR
jgi:putative DNA methylase